MIYLSNLFNKYQNLIDNGNVNINDKIVINDNISIYDHIVHNNNLDTVNISCNNITSNGLLNIKDISCNNLIKITDLEHCYEHSLKKIKEYL
mgnify:CR=1 FL=1